MSEYDDPGPDADAAVEFVLRECPEVVEEEVRKVEAQRWLEGSQPWFQIINIVGGHDREGFRDAIRRWIEGAQESTPSPSQTQLFAIASEVSALLESGG